MKDKKLNFGDWGRQIKIIQFVKFLIGFPSITRIDELEPKGGKKKKRALEAGSLNLYQD